MVEPFRIVWKTDHELVVVKRAGVSCQLTTDPMHRSLLGEIERAFPGSQPRLTHRIDRITRGIVLVALSKEAAAFHGEQIRTRQWRKYYIARTHDHTSGRLADLIGEHKAYLKSRGRREEMVRSGGKPSFLEIMALDEAPGRSGQLHVLVRLLTGRRHQVRVMLAGLGLPLVADPLYGESPISRQGEFYLEHILLDYKHYPDGQRRVVYIVDDPEREALSPMLKDCVGALACGPACEDRR